MGFVQIGPNQIKAISSGPYRNNEDYYILLAKIEELEKRIKDLEYNEVIDFKRGVQQLRESVKSITTKKRKLKRRIPSNPHKCK